MAVTLEQAKLNVQDDLQLGVIDEFRKSTWLFDNLIFDDVVSATGGGATFEYCQPRVLKQTTGGIKHVKEGKKTTEGAKQK